MNTICAGDLVQGPAVTVEPKATLRSVAECLGELSIGLAVVVDDDEVVGVISERDLVWAIARGAALDDVWAADVMTLDLVTVEPSTPVDDVATTMIDANARHLLVSAPGTPGVISVREVIEHLVTS